MSELCFKINKKGIVTECLSQLIEGDLSVLVNKHLSEQNLPNVFTDLISKYLQENNYHCFRNVETSQQFYNFRLLGGVNECTCIINNITSRVKRFSEFDNNSNQFKALVDSTFEIIWSFDKNFILTAANKAFFDLRKKVFDSNIQIGDSFFKDVHDNNIKKWKPIYEQVLDGKKLHFEDERRIGNEFDYAEINLNPVFNGKNEIVGCMGITRDINARKKSEFELKRYNHQLEKFAFKTSHELRRPLANILAIIPLLKEENDLETNNKFLELLRISALQLDEEVRLMNETINTNNQI
jgi:PAS domain S-box-containing protein